ncbi:hypothetical protein FA95DRAFT_1563473 [Auriscalpium vulgare]|uniref:Uncharacterized protein n=1 Tax=Auriscalpium vulgare TaxID=40419 RepID=A0ACB8RH11_9AGAM|nr:hypothetical protein FA95DRAFT_1563473 [Auriscalpium vulgare]
MGRIEPVSEHSGASSTADFWLSILLPRLSRADTCSSAYVSTLRNERAAVASLLLILDARINACAPVSRLPPEVTSTIFSYLLGQERYEHTEVAGHVARTVPWVRLTHVCRQWRHVFLNNAALWRHLVLPLPPKWSEVLLERSQHAPLMITFSTEGLDRKTSRPPQPHWLPVATLERVDYIETFGYEGDEGLDQLLRTPAPLLEDAQLDGVRSSYLFADNAPRLRVLNMSGAHAFPWTASFFPNLVDLKVDKVDESSQSAAEYVAGLRRLSRIETLHLRYCLKPFSSAQPSYTSQISLPSLRVLWIAGRVSQCVGFLRHMQAPDMIALHVVCHANGLSDFSMVYPFLAPRRGYVADPFRYIGFYSTDAYRVTVSGGLTDEDCAVCRMFDLRWKTSDRVVDCVRALCEEIGVRHLRVLSMNLSAGVTDPLLSRETWLDEFGAAVELHTLETSGKAGMALCMRLSASTDSDGTCQPQPPGAMRGESYILWPRLRTLKLEGVSLARCFSQDDGVQEGDESFGVSVGEVLLRALERRQQRGAPLGKLALIRCGATRQWLRRAEDSVGCVSATGDKT